MKEFTIALIYWSFWICKCYGCLATSPGSTPGSPVTIATTTVAPTDCTSCTAGQVTFVPGDPTMGTEDAVNGGTGVDGSGCSTLLAICPENPNGPGFDVFMQFNVGVSGPSDPIGGEVQALLTCANGVWTFTQDGSTVTVTSVNCVIVVP